MLSQPSSGDFPGTEGNEQGGPLCAAEADPITGFVSLPAGVGVPAKGGQRPLALSWGFLVL